MEINNPTIAIPQHVAKSNSENTHPNIAKVQHIAKSSSDQLLRKFAEVGSEAEDRISAKKELRLAKRVKRCQTAGKYGSKSYGESNATDSGNPSCILADRKLLLPPVAASRSKSVALIRRFGMCKTKIRAKELKTKSIISAVEKTWRKTVEGASRVLMEKHYNRHKRLINDT